MHEAGGLERVNATFPLCLDQFWGLWVEKLYSFSGLINIEMQFLIEPKSSFLLTPLLLACMFYTIIPGFFCEDQKGSPKGGTQVHTKEELLGKGRWV